MRHIKVWMYDWIVAVRPDRILNSRFRSYAYFFSSMIFWPPCSRMAPVALVAGPTPVSWNSKIDPFRVHEAGECAREEGDLCTGARLHEQLFPVAAEGRGESGRRRVLTHVAIQDLWRHRQGECHR